MLRLSVRNRFQIPVPDERRAPHLTVIQGGLSFRKEKETRSHFDLGPLVYLFTLRSWLDTRKRKKAAPGTESVFPCDEATGMHELGSWEADQRTPREVYETFLERSDARVERKVFRRESPSARDVLMPPKPSRSLYLSKRVLRQYVRHVIGHEQGMEDYLRGKTEEALRHDSYDLYAMTYDRELERLVHEARAFVRSAEDSGKPTRKGYLVHRVEKGGERFVVTLHHQQSVVVGIYTQARFDRKRSHKSACIISHKRAQLFRKNKPARYCR
jgi:hypothetical protein